MAAEVVILVGIPASGKSTLYRERFAGTHQHVSKDLMRNARNKQLKQDRQVSEALSAGRSIVIDNTNVSRSIRRHLIEQARAHGARVIGYFFPPDREASLLRNRQRHGRARVPEVAVFRMLKQLEPPTLEEGFDELHEVTLEGDGKLKISKLA